MFTIHKGILARVRSALVLGLGEGVVLVCIRVINVPGGVVLG
jgi:hypothetical protein